MKMTELFSSQGVLRDNQEGFGWSRGPVCSDQCGGQEAA